MLKTKKNIKKKTGGFLGFGSSVPITKTFNNTFLTKLTELNSLVQKYPKPTTRRTSLGGSRESRILIKRTAKTRAKQTKKLGKQIIRAKKRLCWTRVFL